MSDTPQTDHNAKGCELHCDYVPMTFAFELERENTDLRAQLALVNGAWRKCEDRYDELRKHAEVFQPYSKSYREQYPQIRFDALDASLAEFDRLTKGQV